MLAAFLIKIGGTVDSIVFHIILNDSHSFYPIMYHFFQFLVNPSVNWQWMGGDSF